MDLSTFDGFPDRYCKLINWLEKSIASEKSDPGPTPHSGLFSRRIKENCWKRIRLASNAGVSYGIKCSLRTRLRKWYGGGTFRWEKIGYLRPPQWVPSSSSRIIMYQLLNVLRRGIEGAQTTAYVEGCDNLWERSIYPCRGVLSVKSLLLFNDMQLATVNLLRINPWYTVYHITEIVFADQLLGDFSRTWGRGNNDVSYCLH